MRSVLLRVICEAGTPTRLGNQETDLERVTNPLKSHMPPSGPVCRLTSGLRRKLARRVNTSAYVGTDPRTDNF